MELNLLFKIIIIFTLIQRVVELFHSRRNEKYILSLGGYIVKEPNYFFMVALHTSWILTLLYLSFNTQPTNKYGFYVFLIIFILGQLLRLIAIRQRGKRWSTRVVILPNKDAIRGGIFKYINHPNYLGVVLELFALPLMIGAFKVAVLFSLLNFIILWFRIRLEEKYLILENNYNEIFEMGD